MRKIIIATSMVVVLIGGGWHHLKQTPQYSLYRFGQALKQHDSETAFRYIDVDAVVDNQIRNVIQDTESQQASSSNPLEQMGDNIAKGLMGLMLPVLKESAKNEIRAAIQEPTKPGNKASFNVFAGASSWRDFDIEEQGKIAIVTKKTDNNFKIKLSQVHEGHWKIVQFSPLNFKLNYEPAIQSQPEAKRSQNTLPHSMDGGNGSPRPILVYSKGDLNVYIPEGMINMNMIYNYPQAGGFDVLLYSKVDDNDSRNKIINSLMKGLAAKSVTPPANLKGIPERLEYFVENVSFNLKKHSAYTRRASYIDDNGNIIGEMALNSTSNLNDPKNEIKFEIAKNIEAIMKKTVR